MQKFKKLLDEVAKKNEAHKDEKEDNWVNRESRREGKKQREDENNHNGGFGKLLVTVIICVLAGMVAGPLLGAIFPGIVMPAVYSGIALAGIIANRKYLANKVNDVADSAANTWDDIMESIHKSSLKSAARALSRELKKNPEMQDALDEYLSENGINKDAFMSALDDLSNGRTVDMNRLRNGGNTPPGFTPYGSNNMQPPIFGNNSMNNMNMYTPANQSSQQGQIGTSTSYNAMMSVEKNDNKNKMSNNSNKSDFINSGDKNNINNSLVNSGVKKGS